jgi:hypothetical protein
MRPFILCCVISIRLMAGVAFGQTASITGLIKDQTERFCLELQCCWRMLRPASSAQL